MIQNVKTIIFDLGGVLLDLKKQACIDAFVALGYHNVRELLGEYAQKGVFLQLEEGLISAPEFRDIVRQNIGKPVSDADIDHALNQFLVDVPDYKLSMLLELRKKYQVFMLSNTNEIMFEGDIKKIFRKQGLEITDYFDRFFLSYEMKVAKPKPLIFENLIAESGINPVETLFLDDSQANLDAASKFGFKTYLARPKEDFRSIFLQ